jgi:hypothetical protein
MNWRTIAVEAIADLGIAAVVLGSSGAISMSSSWVTGMAVGHTFFDSLSGRIKTRIPDPTPIFDALPSPRDAVTVPSNGCAEFLLVTRWKKGMPESLGPIQLK